MEIDALLVVVSQDSPCGPDLGYDPDFMALEQAARGKPEQQFGDTIVPAEEPDWADIKSRAEALFSRTKDLRVAMLLTRALTRSDGMVGFASGLQLIKNLLSQYWDSVHPRIDPAEDHAPTMRLNALAPLTDSETLLRDVRAINFSSTGKHGRVSVRDILITLGKLSAPKESVPSQSAIEEVMRATENASAVQAARNALQAVSSIRAFLGEKVGHERAPDLQPLGDMLSAVVQLCDSPLGMSEVSIGEAPVASVRTSGDIRSRADVSRMLDDICEFIERTEPANPAPLLIRRAQRLMTKNFVEIIQDLAPESLGQIRQIAGLDRE